MTARAHDRRAQSARSVTERDAEQNLLEAFDEISVPMGFRAELIDGEIVVTPPLDGDHEYSIDRIVRQIILNGTDISTAGCKGIITPKGRCVPDITAGPAEAFRGQESWSSAEGVYLVGEVTSSNAETDRVKKRHRYAAADIPMYLLVDRRERTVTLFSDPSVADEDYMARRTVKYGDKLPLAEPFGFDLDTSEFP